MCFLVYVTLHDIKVKEWQWFSNYRKKRKQLVEITPSKDKIAAKTKTTEINRGVPQGPENRAWTSPAPTPHNMTTVL